MKIKDIITQELIERIMVRYPISALPVRRYVNRIRSVPRRPQPQVRKPSELKPMTSYYMRQSQHSNPKIDVTKGPNFKLDNFNAMPELSPEEKKRR